MDGVGNAAKLSVKRLLLIVVLALVSTTFFVFYLNKYLTFKSAHKYHMLMPVERLMSNNAILAPVIFFMAYVAVVAFSLPSNAIMTTTGGFFSEFCGVQ